MASCKMSIVGLILFNIFFSSCAENSTFTQERRLNHSVTPATVNGQRFYTYYNNSNTAFISLEPDSEECKIPALISENDRHELGNGKMIAFTPYYTHFYVLDFKNCYTYSFKQYDGGKPYEYRSLVHSVIPHYDTFDVYNLYIKNCNPCRYNDKGERLQVNSTLKPEYNGPIEDGPIYFVKPISNISGVADGYLYGFSFETNDSTTLKVLDSNYNVIKEQLLDGQYLDLSATHGHVTICTQVNTCPDKYPDCLSPRCQLLDSNLNTIANVSVQQPEGNPITVNLSVKNLADGGAIISTEFLNFHTKSGYHEDIFIQQIHANGEVEPSIRFGSFDAEHVNIYDYFSQNGEYCVVLALREKKDKEYTLIKCVVPKASRKN